MKQVSVIGSGAWGAALAKTFDAGQVIAGRSAATEVDSKYVFIAVEAQKFREVISKHKFHAETVAVICCKGIEQGSLKLMSEVFEELLPNKYAILSGPNFADEIAAGMPSATTISSKDEAVTKDVIKKFGKPSFRFYPTSDIISTQIGGAVKNVLAIATGVCAGLGLGENARAALITRGLAEISRLTRAKGGDERNLSGLAGIGDLILTCGSTKSRNFKFGMEITKAAKVADLVSNSDAVIEGYYTAKSLYDLAHKLKVEMPICFSVYEILYKDKKINEAINDLLERPQG